MRMIETLTALPDYALNQYAVSIGATEYALDTDDTAIRNARTSVAHMLRRMEESHIHDGAPLSPLLTRLRAIAATPDEDDGEYKAHYLFMAEIDRLAAA